MKKTQVLFVAVMLLVSAPALTQQAWVKHTDVEKDFTTGGYIFSFVKVMDAKNASGSLAHYGYFDRTKAYNNYGKVIIQNLLDSNSVKRVNGYFTSAGKMNFTHSHSAINYHDTILGKEYIGVTKNDSGLVFSASFLVLNTANNTYERVGNLSFDQGVKGFLYLGNNKILIFGDFYEASDGVTRQVYNGMAIWDMATSLLSYVPGNVNFGGYNNHSSGRDGATLIAYASYSRLCFIMNGSTDFDEGLLIPKNPIGGRMINICTVSKDTVYAAWQKDSIGWPCYLVKFIRSQGMAWQTFGRLTRASNSSSTSKTWVNSMDWFKNQLYVSTAATHFNGQSLGNNVFIVNPATSAVTNLPIPPTPVEIFEKSRLSFVNDKIYLIEDNGNLVLGTQRIYILRDTTARLPPVVNPLGTQANASVVVYGVVPEPLLYIDLYNKSNNVKLGTTQASTEGTWQIPVTLAEGSYNLWARARNEDTICSPFSNSISFVVSFPTAIGDLINNDDVRVYPNPAKNFFSIKNGKEVQRIVSVSGVLQSRYFVSRTNDGLNVSFNSFAPGLYFVEFKAKDGKRYTKTLFIQ